MIKKLYTGLWTHKEFKKLWAGISFSILGSQITAVAIPLLAAITLEASAGQMGALGAIQFAPYLIIGLFAGVWIDRVNRNKLMIIAAICRALLIITIPVTAVLNIITIEQLYLVGFLIGICNLFFDISYQSFLPTLIGRKNLTEGNAKIEGTSTIIQVSGSSFAGALVQLITAPITLILDSIAYIFSAVFISKLNKEDQGKNTAEVKNAKNILKEISEGLNFVLKNKILRSIAACTATSNFFGRILFTVYVLYLTRNLGLSPFLYGVIIAAGGIGAFLGTVVARKLTNKFGLGRTIVFSILIGNTMLLFVPIIGSFSISTIVITPILILVQFTWSMCNPIYNINQVSVRQTITPTNLLGRMNASMRTIVWGTVPLGYVAGGLLGTYLGIWWTLFVGALGGVFAFLWIFFSVVLKLKDINSLKVDNLSA